MSNRRQIRYDYRVRLRWGSAAERRRKRTRLAAAAALSLLTVTGMAYAISHMLGTESPTAPSQTAALIPLSLPRPQAAAAAPGGYELPFEPRPLSTAAPPGPWRSVIIKSGDTTSYLFDRLSLSKRDLHRILEIGGVTKSLKRLRPQQQLRVRVEDGVLQELIHEQELTTALRVLRTEEGFIAEQLRLDPDKRIATAKSTIESSLFVAGQNAGLTDKAIMQLAGVFGWDIDFVLDIRSGDSFAVVYEEWFKDGKKVKDGDILAAEFTNRGKTYKAVRYVDTRQRVDYYSDSGRGMRKAFLRTPVRFSRISSRFNLQRKHPILNSIRAHRGVDYAAPEGTPVKATGEGSIAFVGNHGGYGKTVILQHGGHYSTLYAHLSRFARGIKPGKGIRQGQVIGYVGTTGLATGPHLHYEFRIDGTHRNPLTVEFPRALPIHDSQVAHFRAQTAPLFSALQHVVQGHAGKVDSEALLSHLRSVEPPSDVSLAQSSTASAASRPLTQ